MGLFLSEISSVFVLAVFSGVLFSLFGLPSLVGQILFGLLVGASKVISSQGLEIIKMSGSFGVALLLFLVGLEMNWLEIRRVGLKVGGLFVLSTALTSMMFSLLIYYFFGSGIVESVLLGLSLSFSSTILVVKVLSEKKDLGSLAGRVSLGVLLLQDMLAMVLLVFLPAEGAGGAGAGGLFGLLSKLLIAVAVVNVFGFELINLLLKKVVKNAEDLVLVGIGWLLISIMFMNGYLGLSVEVSAFLCGLSLSSSFGKLQLLNKVKVFRDIFLTLFFVVTGISVGSVKIDWIRVLLISFLVIIIKIFGVYLVSKILKFSERVSVMVALNLSQVSEFSMIVAGLGYSLRYWSVDVVAIITMVGLVSMMISSVVINKEGSLYVWLVTKVFKKDIDKEQNREFVLKHHVVVVGADRTGRGVISSLLKMGKRVVVVDFNPDTVKRLDGVGVEKVVIADASDPEIVEDADLVSSDMIVSTIKDFEDTLLLLKSVRSLSNKILFVADAETVEQADQLYQGGANYVVLTHYVSGWHLGSILKSHFKDSRTFSRFRKKQADSVKQDYGH